MTRPTNCTCLHLGTGVHDPTNPHCALFNGADLRVTDDEPTHAEIVDKGIAGRPIADNEYAVSDMNEIHRLPAITIQDTSEDEHRAKAAKLARTNHAFTNFGDPGGLCSVCGAGAGNEIHAAPPVQAQPIRDVKMVGVPKRPILADHVFVYTVRDNDNVIVCGECGLGPDAHTVPEDFPTGTPHLPRDWPRQTINVVGPEPIPVVLDQLNTQIALPSLIVNVDLNELLSIHGEQETFRLLGNLKDLLS